MVTPPPTVKAELAVVVPIPTLPDTPNPLAGAAPPMNDEPITVPPLTLKDDPMVAVVPIPTLPPANRPNRDDPEVKDGVVPEKVKAALLAAIVTAPVKVEVSVTDKVEDKVVAPVTPNVPPTIVLPVEATVKLEVAPVPTENSWVGVVVPIPTLPWTNNPFDGAMLLRKLLPLVAMVTPPPTVKAELAVVVPIPTLPCIPKPLAGPTTEAVPQPITPLPETAKFDPAALVPIPTLPITFKAEVGPVVPIPTLPETAKPFDKEEAVPEP